MSRNPNICASCSSLVDGMQEAAATNLPDTASSPEESESQEPDKVHDDGHKAMP